MQEGRFRLLRAHRADRLAAAEQHAFALAARDPDVAVARLAGAVHDAAHHGDLQRLADPEYGALDPARQPHAVPFAAAARRAGYDLDVILFQPAGAQDALGRDHFLDGVVRQRDAERVADPVQEQRADADAALDDAALARARLRHAQMQRMIRPLREHPIRLDRERHGGSLDGDDDVADSVLFQPRHVEQGALDESARRPAVFLQMFALDAARVGAHAYGDAVRPHAVRHPPDGGLPADVAGIDADLIRPVLH